jgi:hypothetical protein
MEELAVGTKLLVMPRASASWTATTLCPQVLACQCAENTSRQSKTKHRHRPPPIPIREFNLHMTNGQGRL